MISLFLAAVADAEDVPVDLEMRIHAFGDIGVDAMTENHPVGFDVGDAVLAYQANLGRRFALDLDVVLGLDQYGDWLALLDRVVIDVEAGQALTIRGGKMYLPIGYWNANIPYGGFLYAPQFRPAMLEFERHGAVIPIHQAGLDLSGTFLRGLWRLGYHLGVGNGRSPHLTETQDIGDGASMKAFWAQAYVESPGHVQLGVSGYYDDRIQVGHRAMDLSEDFGDQGDVNMASHTHTDEVVLQSDVREWIAAGHLAWNGPHDQLLLEAMVVGHDRLRSPDVLDIPPDPGLQLNLDGYAQYSHEFGPVVTPYLRWDYVELWHEDPLYVDLGKTRVQGAGTVGSRFDLGEHVAVKLEGTVQRDVIFPYAGLGLRTRDRLGAGAYLVAGF